jgi:hypothetical protein
MYLAVQVIDIAYDKDARGGAGAVERARVAQARQLPAGDDGGVLHCCWLSSQDDYAPRETTSAVSWRDGELSIGLQRRFLIRIDGDALVIRRDPGAEVWKTRPIDRVPIGAWARVRWNEIRRRYERRWFGETVMNVGLFATAPVRGVFFDAPPISHDLRHDQLRNGSRVE